MIERYIESIDIHTEIRIKQRMNEIFIYQDQRQKDRTQILEGIEVCLHTHSSKFYSQKERIRQKNENYLISSLKKSAKNINPSSKKQLYARTVSVMNFYLAKEQHLVNIDQVFEEKTKDEEEDFGYNFREVRERKTKEEEARQRGRQEENYDSQRMMIRTQELSEGKGKLRGDTMAEKILEQIEQNFYQLYINIFVTFFNHMSFADDPKVKPEFVKNIIRPNNRFVLMDLIKALLEYCRKDFKDILSSSVFYFKEPVSHQQMRTEFIEIEEKEEEADYQETVFDNEEGTRYPLKSNLVKGSSASQHRSGEGKKRIHTQPEIQILNNYTFHNTRAAAISKASTLSVARQEAEVAKKSQNLTMFHNFVEYQVKQNNLQRNNAFAASLNLDKIEEKMNNLFTELTKLNYVNSQMIDRFFEHAIGRKQKFNYDCRGLYSEQEKEKKKEFIRFEIYKFQNLEEPNEQSSTIDLARYAESHIKKHTYYEELRTLEIKKGVSPYPSSPWIPLCAQLSNSVFSPINLCIYQINALSSDALVYHWTKYRKQYQMSEFMKQKIKSAYSCSLSVKLLDVINSHDKKGFTSLFKKYKFRKNLFIDSKKKVNELLQSNNNLIISKKESIFPALKGIQENFIKNNFRIQTQTQINTQVKYSLGTISSKTIDRVKETSSAQLKTIETLEKKGNTYQHPPPSLSYMRSTGQKRRDDSKSERKLVDLKEKEKESPKLKKQRPQILSRLVAKYDINPPNVNPLVHDQEKGSSKKETYEKKNMISMTRLASSELKKGDSIKPRDPIGVNSPLKSREYPLNQNSFNDNKMSILHLIDAEHSSMKKQTIK